MLPVVESGIWGRTLLCVLAESPFLAAFVYLVFQIPGIASWVFAAVGAMICLFQALSAGIGYPMSTGRYSISALLARSSIDLVTLLAIHLGFNQARIEMERGSWMGVSIIFMVVTPLLAYSVRSLARFLARQLLAEP